MKVLDNPTIETYRQSFGPIFAAQNAGTANTLKKHLTDWLKRRQATEPLATAIAAEAPP